MTGRSFGIQFVLWWGKRAVTLLPNQADPGDPL
jgi:hypothetical protein